jgi:hypothetical protein
MLRRCLKAVFRWLSGIRFSSNPDGRKPPPGDPDSFVRHPTRRGPPSLAAAVALEEPPPPNDLNLFGRPLKKPSS